MIGQTVYNLQVDQSNLWLPAMHKGVLLNSCQSLSGVKQNNVVLQEKPSVVL